MLVPIRLFLITNRLVVKLFVSLFIVICISVVLSCITVILSMSSRIKIVVSLTNT